MISVALPEIDPSGEPAGGARVLEHLTVVAPMFNEAAAIASTP
jgi:hypothetical protein